MIAPGDAHPASILTRVLIQKRRNRNITANRKNAKKAEQEKEKAVNLRLKAMERISEIQKRKKDGDKQVKTKNRKSGKETIPYLVEKGNRDAELKKQELEIRKAEVEAEKNRHDEMAQSENIIMSLLCLSRTE